MRAQLFSRYVRAAGVGLFFFALPIRPQGLSPVTPSKEYVRLNGQVIAIENSGAAAAAPNSIVIASGNPQLSQVSTLFGSPLVVLVANKASQPLSGITVTFTSPSSGAGALFNGAASIAVVTDSAGHATSPVPAANGTAGGYSISASVAGLPAVLFALTNEAATGCATPSGISLVGTGGWECWTSSLLGPFATPSYGGAFWNNFSGDGNQANIGWLLTGTGSNYGPIFGATAPGTLPFWGSASGGGPTSFYFSGGVNAESFSLLAHLTSNYPNETVGWYPVNPSNPNAAPTAASMYPLFQGGAAVTTGVIAQPYFGLYMQSQIGTYFTQSQFNPSNVDAKQHFAVFLQPPSTYYVGIEDTSYNANPAADGDYNDAILQVTAASSATSAAATYTGADSISQGMWTGKYGLDGQFIAEDLTNAPPYATVAFTGSSTYTWIKPTNDVRALQLASGAATRTASDYYAASSFSIDVNLADSNTHRVALYLCDWDYGGRTETITIVDANTHAVLSSQTFSGFQNGEYAMWNVKGHVTIQLTGVIGATALVNGVFFDPATPVSAASYTGADSSAQGMWTGKYGLDGQFIAEDLSNAPSYAAVNFSGSSTYTWIKPTSDARALQLSSGAAARTASDYYAASSFSIDVNLLDSNTHRIALYLCDWDYGGRTETVSILDANTHAVLSTQTFSGFQNGEYALWNIKGHVTIQVAAVIGATALVNGVFFDPAPSATYAGTDIGTQGAWTGKYGLDGRYIAEDLANAPSYGNVTFAGSSTYTWIKPTSDARALQVSSGATTRTASDYYSSNTFSIDVNPLDSNTHRIALYLCDWDYGGRTETVSILDANTHAVLSTQTFSGFQNGEYAIWNIKGHVTVQFTAVIGATTLVNGIFFDPATPAATAAYTGADTSTQGTWTGKYGLDGQFIAEDLSNAPAYAVVSFTGSSTYTWIKPTTDARALQLSSGATTRTASDYYSSNGFSIDVNLLDANSHRIALYLCDWDYGGRTETISILDANSQAVLSRQTFSGFQNGEYAVWNVKGHVIIQMTRVIGATALVNGLFFK